MPPYDSATAVGGVLTKAGQNAAGLEHSNQQLGDEASAFDVWTQSYDGMSERLREFADDPVGTLEQYDSDLNSALEAGLTGAWLSSSGSEVDDSIAAQAEGLGGMVDAIGEAEGALATVGATFALLTGVEQMFSTLLSVIPFPALPAIRVTDMDVGLPHGHGHPPNLVPPAPMVPLPSTGPIVPIPILSGATRTLINGMPAARCGDMGLGVWCGGYFPLYEVFLGSSNVWIEGARAGRVGVDITKHCIFSSPKPQDLPLGPPVGATVMGSGNVLIGGVPMPSLLSLAMAAALKGLMKGLGKVRASRAMSAVSYRVHQAAMRAMRRLGVRPSLQNRVHRAICTATGHPVDVATGKVFTEAVDFELPGPIPFRWERVWYSCSAYDGPLGHGWHHTYDLAMCERDGAVALRMADGRPAAFPSLRPGGQYYDRASGLTLRRDAVGYVVVDERRLCFRFVSQRTDPSMYVLLEIRDSCGNRVQLQRDETGRLVGITDCVRRHVRVAYDEAGRIVALIAPDPLVPSRSIEVVRYAYEAGELTGVTGVNGAAMKYRYRNHLLIGETSRNGTAFSFEYDGDRPGARCVATSGGDGAFQRVLVYDTSACVTTVTDSRGACASYEWNELGLVTRERDPAGAVRTRAFSPHGELLTEVHPNGVESVYTYDGAGRTVRIDNVDGMPGIVVEQEYDESGRLVRTESAVDGERQCAYDDRDCIIWKTGPEGETSLGTDAHGRVIRSRHAASGRELRFEYDLFSTLARVTDGAGRVLWEGVSDAWGQLRREVRGGVAAEYDRDAVGRITRALYSTGAITACGHDGDGNVVRQIDTGNHVYELSFGTVNRIARLVGPQAAERRFEYDREGGLTASTDAIGCKLTIGRTPSGDIATILRAGREVVAIERDTRGFIRSVRRPGVTTTYDRETTAEAVRTEILHEGPSAHESIVRVSAPHGLPKSVLTASMAVEYEHDSVGRKTLEHYDDFALVWAHRNGAVRLTTPMGAVEWRSRPGTLEIADETGARMSVSSDGVRRFASGVVETRRSAPRRALFEHVIRHRERILLSSRITRLPSGPRLRESWSDGRDRVFEYDAEDRVIAAREAGGEVRLEYDAAGNLERLADGRTVRHTKDHRMISAGPIRFDYDEAGRRIGEHDGRTRHHYGYDLRGNLVAFERSGGAESWSYEYDGLCRRIRKVSKGRTRRFYWDGPRLLVEWEEDWSRIYIYLPGEFWTPTAFLEFAKGSNPRFFAVHSSSGVVPDAVTDESGAVVWHAQYDICGAASLATYAAIEFNLRLPGQYEDPESGLHYNRYRHYDPRTGRYLQPDPLLVVNSHRLYQYTGTPLDRYDYLGLTQCGKGGRWGTETASSRASAQGIAARKRLARERLLRGEYDPLADTLTPDELVDFLDNGRLPDDVRWHHTTQTSSDPSMADVPESIQPVRHKEHVWGEHGGDTGGTPTAGIRGDVTSPDSPIYDPNAPDVQTQRYDPNAPSDLDPDL